MLLAGMSLVIMILMRRIYRRKRTGKKSASTQTNAAKSYSQPLIDAPPEVSRWQVEMHELSRELRAELDSKAVMVQTLLAMLREEVDRLEDVLARTNRANPDVPASGDTELLSEIRRLTAEINAHGEHEAEHAVTRNHPLNEVLQTRIYSLADQGHAADVIARQLSIPQADVELTLSLRSE
jgi:hypothetical protein